MRKIFGSGGQVWVETVTYTLIALVLIGAVLVFVKPKLEELKSTAVIDQTIEVLEYMNKNIEDTADGAVGNRRIPEFTLKEGRMEITTKDYEEKIVLTLENSASEYSEPGAVVNIGNVEVQTIDKGKYNEIKLTLNYEGEYDFLDENGGSETITVSKSSTPQKISFSKTKDRNGATDGSAPCVSNSCPDDGKVYTRDYCDASNICKHEDIRPVIKVKVN